MVAFASAMSASAGVTGGIVPGRCEKVISYFFGAGLVCSGAEEVLPYVNVVESAGASSWTSLLSGSAGNMSPIGL